MAGGRKIPPELHPEMRQRAGRAETGAQIAAWLATKDVHVTPRAVQKWLAAERSERADVAKTVVRERLAKDLPADLDELERVRVRLRKVERRHKTSDAPGAASAELRALELQAKVIDLKLHYSGAGEPDAVATAAAGVVILPPLDPDA